jgi:hypothetical protein
MKQKNRTTRWGLAAMALALFAGGCGDSTAPNSVDDQFLVDMAVVAADATLEDLGSWTQPFGFGLQGAHGMPGASVPGRPGGHQGVGGPFSGTRSVTFFDADGNEQDGYDALTTASIHFVSEVSGEVSRDTWSASLDRTRDMTISGLAGEETERIWNGSGSEEVSRSRHLDDGGTRSYDLSGTFSYADVVVPAPGSDTRFPTSGTITRSMNVTIVNGPDGDGSKTVNVTITFDGDDTATLVINGEEMEIDLTTRQGRFPLKPRGRGHRGG